MKTLLLMAILFLSVNPTLKIDSRYSGQIIGALSLIRSCSPESYANVSIYVREIDVSSDQMSTGLAHPEGRVSMGEFIFVHPELYFPPAELELRIATMIVHEARHEWQQTQPGWKELLTQYSVNRLAHDLVEQDAYSVSDAFFSKCSR